MSFDLYVVEGHMWKILTCTSSYHTLIEDLDYIYLRMNYDFKLLVLQLDKSLIASAHSFKLQCTRNKYHCHFIFQMIMLSMPFSLCIYIHQIKVTLDFIYLGPVDLPGARQNTK